MYVRMYPGQARVTGREYVSVEQYDGLVELLVFHALLPLGLKTQAHDFIKNNQVSLSLSLSMGVYDVML